MRQGVEFKLQVMKKILMVLIGCALLLQGSAQMPEPGKTKEYYYNKSEELRREAWLKLIVGGGMMIGGALAFISSLDSDSGSSSGVLAIVMLGGFPVALTSVPTFVKASKYEKRADMMVQFKLQPPPPGLPGVARQIPSVGIRIQW